MKSRVWKITVFIFPLLFVAFMLYLRKYHFYTYDRIGAEDNLLEWIQFFLYLFSGILTILLGYRYRKNKFLLAIYILLTLGMFFIAFEEISWGERVCGFTDHALIPENLLERNVQGEINFHNIDSFHSKIGYLYILIGIGGCFSWVGIYFLEKSKKVKKDFKKILRHISPTWIFFFYFFPLFINLLSTKRYGFMPQDYEVAETCLALGVFLFFLGNYITKMDDIGIEPMTPTM